LAELYRCGLIKIQYWNVAEKCEQRMKLSICSDLVFESPGATNNSQSSTHLFLDIDDGGANCVGGRLLQPGTQASIGRLVLALDNSQMVCV